MTMRRILWWFCFLLLCSRCSGDGSDAVESVRSTPPPGSENAPGSNDASDASGSDVPAASSGCAPFIEVLPSNHRVANTQAIYLPRNLKESDGGASFATRRLLMRPLRLGVKNAGAAAVLSADSADVVEVYRTDGSPVALPATFTQKSEVLLISGRASGSASLSLKCAGAPELSASALLRVAPMSGLAGYALDDAPFFYFASTVNAGEPVRVFFDSALFPERIGLPYDLYVVPHKTAVQWSTNQTLGDITGRVEHVQADKATQLVNLVAWNAAQPGNYDVVFDFGGGPENPDSGPNGRLDPGDLIGRLSKGDDAEVKVLQSPGASGALSIKAHEYSAAPLSLPSGFDGLTGACKVQSKGLVVYPDPVPERAPLVLMLHGNHTPLYVPDPMPGGAPRRVDAHMTSDENYRGFRYLQEQLASQGYVSLSVSLDDIQLCNLQGLYGSGGPGIRSRGWVALKNLEAFFTNAAAAGPTLGKIDKGRIFLFGHSRGGEGVLQAHLQLQNPLARPKTAGGTPEQLTDDSGARWTVRGIISVSPVTMVNDSFPSVPYLLVWGLADGDVSGLASSVQPPQIYDGMRGDKMHLAIAGANHNYFNSSWPCSDAAERLLGSGYFLADCRPQSPPLAASLLSASDQQAVLRAYLHAFLKVYAEGQTDYLDYFARPQARFRPTGVRADIPIYAEFRPAAASGILYTLDDYEKNSDPQLSSSNQTVAASGVSVVDRQLAPGSLLSGTRVYHRTAVGQLTYGSAAGSYSQSVDPAYKDFSTARAVSFRMASSASAPIELAVSLRDEAGQTSSLPLGALMRLPAIYERRDAVGGSNLLTTTEFVTYRIDPRQFLIGGALLNLERVVSISIENVPGSSGVFAVDDIEITVN